MSQRFKSRSYTTEEQERLAKQLSLRVSLKTYLNVCVSNGMMNRAHSTILAYRQRANRWQASNAKLITIDFYNILLHGFAEAGNYSRFKDILLIIEEDKLAFNEQTFAAMFECLGRQESSEENSTEIRKYIKKAEEMVFLFHLYQNFRVVSHMNAFCIKNFSLNQIMDRSKFIADQRTITLKAIQRIHPSFQPEYTCPELKYSNVLLNHLNEKYHKDNNEVKSFQTKYTKEQLEQWARDQLKIELDGFITIKSIEKSLKYENTELCVSIWFGFGKCLSFD